MRQKNPHPAIFYLDKLAKEWKPGLLLDCGCGGGDSMLPFAKNNFKCVGIDLSEELIKIGKKQAEKNNVNFEFETGNIMKLPFENEKFDYAISFAVIHHLDSERKRLKALSEMRRILKKDGKIFISVRNKDYPEYYDYEKDVYIPWKHNGIKHQRYFHLFTKDELENLIKKAEFKIEKAFVDESKKNICIIAKR
jgi:ubiquinone/menaquinone biosynthesis C-methylase UbiE